MLERESKTVDKTIKTQGPLTHFLVLEFSGIGLHQQIEFGFELDVENHPCRLQGVQDKE